MGHLQAASGPDEGHLLCTVCAKTYADRRTCPVHADEPLLDTRIDEVVLRLEEDDDRNRRKLIGRWTMLLAVPVLLLTMVFVVAVGLGGLLGGLLAFSLVGMAVGLGVGIGNRSFKPRFTRWTKRVQPKPELADD